MSEKKVVPVEVYTRVVGYHRPIDQTNKGKKAEINDRKTSNIEVYVERFHWT